jgi:prepilin-type N-terminal cleavage/methylation domain-containing protein
MTIHRNARGFTLIELLVVIGIIGILVALAISIGAKVTSGGKAKATEAVLKNLETALTELQSARGGIPPPTVLDPRMVGATPNATVVWPVADALAYLPSGDTAMINSVGLFIAQCKGTPAAEAAIAKIDARFLRTYDPDGQGAPFDDQPELLTAMDGWDHPIRYVHPAFHGIVGSGTGNPPTEVDAITVFDPGAGKAYPSNLKIRRGSKAGSDPADSDGGLCPGSRPYFYSCGPDGDPSTTADNIYTTAPTVQKN